MATTMASWAAATSSSSLRDDLRGALTLADPVAFSRAAGIEPDPWQAQVLRSPSQRILLNCSRQAGKSSVASVLAAHVAMYRERSLTMILSPIQPQSVELLRKVKQVFTAVGWPVSATAEGTTHLELANGSRVLAMPGSETGVRSYTVDLLLVDEAARVEDELYYAAAPLLAASRGRTVALGTPRGQRGWYFESCRNWYSQGWEYHEVPAPEVPHRVPPEFLEAERQRTPPFWFNQEYLCSFEASATALFSAQDIQAVFSDEEQPWSLRNLATVGRQYQEQQRGMSA